MIRNILIAAITSLTLTATASNAVILVYIPGLGGDVIVDSNDSRVDGADFLTWQR